ncbi:MAG: hypothetical protein CR994_04975 [Maribacter sp.]|nr:MAG: hypothetical protein CR994_04975 [Maribacter sp.]
MRKIVPILFFAAFVSFAQEGQGEKPKEKAYIESANLTWKANKDLSEGDFIAAEAGYRKAISKSGENTVAPYNLGNAYYNKESYAEAFGRFKQAGDKAMTKENKHKAYHNMGNVFMKQKEYRKAVEAYKEALRNNPKDEETRYNLALAKELLKKQQDEQDKNDENKDNQDQKDQKDQKDKDQKNDGDNKKEDQKDKGDSDKKDKDDEGDKGDEKKEDKKNGEQEKPEQGDKPQGQQQQPRPNQLSKQQIQNLLEAMQNEENKVQEKIDAKKVKGVKVKNEKDW